MRLALRTILVAVFGAAYWWLAVYGWRVLPTGQPEVIARDAAGIAFWLALAWFLTEILRQFVIYQARRQGLEQRVPRLLLDIGAIVIFFCAGLIIVSHVLGLALSGLLVTSGIIAAAAGFALQPTATDLIAGISLNFREGTVKLGDWVQVANGVIGKVIQITWSDTHLVTLDDRMVVVRNSKLVELQLMNFNAPQRPFQTKLKITVGYEAPPERVAAILVTAMKAVPKLLADPEPYVVIEELADNGVPYSMYYHVPDYPDAQFITNQVAINALKFLDQAGFAPAYPRREMTDARRRAIERRVDIAAIMARVPLFSGFDQEEVAELAAVATLQQIKPDTVIMRQGEPGGGPLYIVVSGLLDVHGTTPSGETRKLNTLVPGDVIGETSFLTGATRSATVTATAPTSLIELDKSRLEPVLQEHPELLEELSQLGAERAASNVSTLTFTPAEQQEIARVGMTSFLRGKIRRFFSMAGP
jgi:small-conductance mechanosensitive channel